jgi:putative multiple sugar transport system substrate-binding protein
MRLRSLTTALSALALTATVTTACGSSEKTIDQEARQAAGKGSLIGITMPTRSSERWISDGNNVKAGLEKLGYKVDLQYAEDSIPTQASQIENQITKGARALVVASIDGTALTSQLQQAADNKIPVIAYDRLIRQSPNVDYYATFDNFKVGVQQATSLLIGLKVKNADGSEGSAKGPFNVELFAGSPDDNNATFFWEGAMSVLQPMIDSGDIVVPSGQTDFDQAAILRWDPATAQKRMEDILTSTYASETVDGVLSPYDGLSLGIIAALEGNGYGPGGKDLPVVTGQDAEVQSVKSIIAGEQYSTIFKDTRELAKVTVDMIKAIGAGDEPEVNDTETYDNGVKVVPSYLLDPVVVEQPDVETVLVDSGYFTADELK